MFTSLSERKFIPPATITTHLIDVIASISHRKGKSPLGIRPTRIFVVGFPRSGTTLLQSLLCAHEDIFGFTETDFFYQLKERKRKQQIRTFIQGLDEKTTRNGKTVWVEKTPRHLHHIKTIERHIPNAHFIHIVRNAPDAIASLIDLRRRFPNTWRGPTKIARCVARWKRDLQISLSHAHKPHHKLITYERLTHQPENVLVELCRFLKVPYSSQMCEEYSQQVCKITKPHEHWKKTNTFPIKCLNGTKFYSVLSKSEQIELQSALNTSGETT